MIRSLALKDIETLKPLIELECPSVWTWGLEKYHKAISGVGIENVVGLDLEPHGLSGLMVYADTPAHLEVLWLWTPQHLRGQGFGAQMLKWLTDQAVSRLCPVWLETHEKNLVARDLYIGLGFKQVGVRPAYYPDGGAAVLYEFEVLP